MNDASLSDAARPWFDASVESDAARSTNADASLDAIASTGCGQAAGYPAGTTADQLTTGRTFRVHVPPGYDGSTALPLVAMLHGGGGSGRQFEENSADMDSIADREHFITVYPDGSGVLKSWNGGGCCAYAMDNDVDDVGFIAALLDHLESTLCIDQRRVFATGMSNGAILTHRLACELAGRFAAIAPVSGTDMTASCTPTRPVALMHTHGTADGHVPWDGGAGCGPTDVPFTSVPESMERWRTRDACSTETSVTLTEGDGTCTTYQNCHADVTLCAIAGGGHSWPSGQPPADLTPCPGNGPQSSSFHASENIWSFFTHHPRTD